MAGRGLVLAGVLPAHQGPAGRGKETGLAVDGLQVVRGADEGMIAPEAAHLGTYVSAIGRYVRADLVGVAGEHAGQTLSAMACFFPELMKLG